MNKNITNMLLAFLIIVLSFRFFTSRLYYEKILRRPYPFESKQVKNKESKELPKNESSTEEKESTTDLEKGISSEDKGIVTETAVFDTQSSDTTPIDTVWIETDKILCGISEFGGRIISLKTKEYTYKNGTRENKDNCIELLNIGNIGGANLSINAESFDKSRFEFSGDSTTINIGDKKNVSLNFIYTGFNNRKIVKRFTFYKKSYTIGYKIITDEIIEKKVTTGWKGGIKESEQSTGRGAQFNRKKIHFYGGGNSEHLESTKEENIERSGDYNWVAISSKYFSIALLPENVSDGTITVASYYTSEEKDKKKNERNTSLSIEFERFCNTNEESFRIYAGPTKIDELKKLNVKLEKVLFGVSTGVGKFFAAIFIGGKVWFPKLCEFVLLLLIKLQKVVIDYGIVIILLTIILKIVTYPLTQSSMKSMNKMKEIQPRINKIRERYKGNPQVMNQKIMEFYRKEGINPLGGMGGCLPMILQMPIMVSLFVVLRKAIELRGQGTFLIPWIKDLSQAEVLFPIPINIPLYGSNFALLPVIMAVLMYFQNKSQIKDPNQKAMIYMMPVMMLVMFNNFPSGLCLYFTFSTALQLLQQKFMDKKKAAQ